jgi:hypothetical protein
MNISTHVPTTNTIDLAPDAQPTIRINAILVTLPSGEGPGEVSQHRRRGVPCPDSGRAGHIVFAEAGGSPDETISAARCNQAIVSTAQEPISRKMNVKSESFWRIYLENENSKNKLAQPVCPASTCGRDNMLCPSQFRGRIVSFVFEAQRQTGAAEMGTGVFSVVFNARSSTRGERPATPDVGYKYCLTNIHML